MDEDTERMVPQVRAVGLIRTDQATPELFAALSKAQEQVTTVTKGGYNQHASYKYATAEDMIATARVARCGTGLALVTSWEVEARPDAPPVMYLHWLLTHSSGGLMRGSVTAPIQDSKRNGTDKQTAALATYLEGFVERGLMRLDREGTPPEEDRDSQRDEVEDLPSKPEPLSPAPSIVAYQEATRETYGRVNAAVKDNWARFDNEGQEAILAARKEAVERLKSEAALADLGEAETAEAWLEAVTKHKGWLRTQLPDIRVMLEAQAEAHDVDGLMLEKVLHV